MSNASEPKILIISESFSAGSAITGINLFSKWSKDNLLCASPTINEFSCNFSSYYYLGNKERDPFFPLNIIKKFPESRIINCNEIKIQNKKNNSVSFGRKVYKKIVPLLEYLGLYNYRIRYRLSSQFCSWINENKPKYIYSSIGSIGMAKFILDILDQFSDVKLITHGYDDWVYPRYRTIAKKYLIRRADSLMQKIVIKSSKLFAVSELMATEYEMRYGRKFYPFPNPVGVDKEPNFNYVDSPVKRITYIGKIASFNAEAICEMMQAVDLINNSDRYKIIFDIYTGTDDLTRNSYISYKGMNTIFHSAVPNEEIPSILKKSTILYLPVSISDEIASFTKYSISTKLSEYFASGTPVIYCGPDSIAMADIIRKYKCAFSITEKGVDKIYSAVIQLLDDKVMMAEYSKNAYNLAATHFDKSVVAQKFYEAIVEE